MSAAPIELTVLPLTFRGKHTLFGIPLFGRWLRHAGGLQADYAAFARRPAAPVRPLEGG